MNPFALGLAEETDTALRATYEALVRPYSSVCAWCKVVVITVRHPESTGICEECLEARYPSEREPIK